MSTERSIKAQVKREREYRPFAELSHAHWVMLQNLREKRAEYVYEAMSCLILAAFKCEGLCNQIGEQVVRGWESVEYTRFRKKLEFLSVQIDYQLDFGSRPLQTIAKIFRARNDLAHPRAESLKSNKVEYGTQEEIRRRWPQTFAEGLCTIEFAEIAYEDTEKFADELYQAAKLDLSQLRRSGAGYSIKRI